MFRQCSNGLQTERIPAPSHAEKATTPLKTVAVTVGYRQETSGGRTGEKTRAWDYTYMRFRILNLLSAEKLHYFMTILLPPVIGGWGQTTVKMLTLRANVGVQ